MVYFLLNVQEFLTIVSIKCGKNNPDVFFDHLPL